jgi:hypothetical protein
MYIGILFSLSYFGFYIAGRAICIPRRETYIAGRATYISGRAIKNTIRGKEKYN